MKNFLLVILFFIPATTLCMEGLTTFDRDVITKAQPLLAKADAPFFPKDKETPTKDDKTRGFALRLAITKLSVDATQQIALHSDQKMTILDSFRTTISELNEKEEKRIITINQYLEVAKDLLKRT